MTKSHKLLLWSPRILGIVVSGFLGLFALDAFAEGISSFLLHLAPAILLSLVVAASWRREWVGAVVFVVLAGLYSAVAWPRVDWLLGISGPLLVVGSLFLWSWRRHGALHGTAAVLVLLLLAPATATAQTVIESNTPQRERDVIFVPTREAVAAAMMKLAGVSKNDVVYDLGCGDGALVIAAARLGARVVGIDIDPQRIKEATENVRAAGVQDRVTLIRGDIFDPAIKIQEASVVTLYLLQRLNEQLMPRLKADLKVGSRVVSHAFSMGNSWPPDRTELADGTQIHLWTIK